MKKRILIVGVSALVFCVVAFLLLPKKAEADTDNLTTIVQWTRTAVERKGGKTLVAYFSFPETDGVDASSGASRLQVEGELMGNTQYVASVISKATGGDLFEIKTVRAYPGSHKALIEAAKIETDNDARPKLATHIKNLKDYDVVFVGFPNWWYDMPKPLYTFFDEYDF